MSNRKITVAAVDAGNIIEPCRHRVVVQVTAQAAAARAQASKFAVLLLLSPLILGGCGSGMGGCDNAKDGSATVVTGVSSGMEEAPQYTQPTMDNLQGKPQQFPGRYAVKQYPNSRVVMAYVKPNLKPGYKNVVLLSSVDAKPTIAVYYRNQLAHAGWEMTYQYENPCFSCTRWTKKTEHGVEEVEVRVSPDPYGKQAIQLLSGPYKKLADYSTPKKLR